MAPPSTELRVPSTHSRAASPELLSKVWYGYYVLGLLTLFLIYPVVSVVSNLPFGCAKIKPTLSVM